MPVDMTAPKHPLSQGQTSVNEICWREHNEGSLCMIKDGHPPDLFERRRQRNDLVQRYLDGEVLGQEELDLLWTLDGLCKKWFHE